MLADLKAAEFPLVELKDWYSASDLLEIGFTVQQMRVDAKYTALELKDAGCTAEELVAGGCEARSHARVFGSPPVV